MSEAGNRKPFYLWEPKPDITTFELAQCMKMFITAIVPEKRPGATWEALPDGAKRHFRIKE